MVDEQIRNDLDFKSLEGILGIDEAIKLQKEKLEILRKEVRQLTFKKIDIAGNYASITFKAFDGGKMRINFNPFEINFIVVADSNENKRIKFVVPEITGYGDNDQVRDEIIKEFDKIPVIANFVKLLKKRSISEISSILQESNNLMELAEYACIFERLTAGVEEPMIIMKDGLLRTKVIKSESGENYIGALRDIIKQNKKYVKLVGVSKTSAVLSLITTALFLEKKIPSDSIGYIKIPLSVELRAYRWSGVGRLDEANPKPLTYAFGEIYVAKLSKDSNLLVTIEIPKDSSGKDIYTESEVNEILSFLAKDSKFSYPVVGYPQTIMRAHETAVRLGFTASIIKDEIMLKIMKDLDKEGKDFIRDGWLLMDFVNKGILGGGGNA